MSIAVLENSELLPAGTPVSLAFGRSLSRLAPARPAEPHADGIPTRPYYLTRQRFDVAGQWWVVASTAGKQGATQLDVINAGDTQVPLPGKHMVPVATPTLADHRGVEPICTRQPACPLHEVSLDAALNEHRPLAVLFATPALCESRTCGPVISTSRTSGWVSRTSWSTCSSRGPPGEAPETWHGKRSCSAATSTLRRSTTRRCTTPSFLPAPERWSEPSISRATPS